MIPYTALLFYGILTLWIGERWAWSLFQAGIFALAIWRGVRLSVALIPLGVAVAIPLAQVALGTTVSPGVTLNAAFDWLTFASVFALGCEVLAAPEDRERFLRAVAAIGATLALLFVAQQYTAHGKVFWLFASGFEEGVVGPFVNRNQFAAWVELLLPIALYTRLGPASAALFLAAAASSSRAGFGLAAVETVVVIAVLTRRPKLVLATAALALAVGWVALHSRFNSGPETLRAEAVRASLEMIRDRPWTGFGVGTWSLIYPRYATFDPGAFFNQAHNDWLQWAAEGGIPLLLAMGVFTAMLWRRAIPSIYGLGAVAFLLHALVDFPMQQRPALAAWFFAIAAAACSASPNGKPGLLRSRRPDARHSTAVEDGPRVLLE